MRPSVQPRTHLCPVAELRSLTAARMFTRRHRDANARLRGIALSSRAGVHEERLPQLVNQILGGSSEALGELYVACEGYVFEIAHRVLGSVSDAEDIPGHVYGSTKLPPYIELRFHEVAEAKDGAIGRGPGEPHPND